MTNMMATTYRKDKNITMHELMSGSFMLTEDKPTTEVIPSAEHLKLKPHPSFQQ